MTNFNKIFNEINDGKHTNKILISFFGSPNFVLVPKRHLDRYLNDDQVSMIIDGKNGSLIDSEVE